MQLNYRDSKPIYEQISNQIKKYIIDGGYYSPEVPGVPIAFTASYLMDNSPVYTKFKINIPN